ncbi:hypothetical protein ACTTZI_004155 [Vibrio vulnificus]
MNRIEQAEIIISTALHDIDFLPRKGLRDNYLVKVVKALNELHMCSTAQIVQSCLAPTTRRTDVKSNLMIAKSRLDGLKSMYIEHTAKTNKNYILDQAKKMVSIYGDALGCTDSEFLSDKSNILAIRKISSSVVQYVKVEIYKGNVRNAGYYLTECGIKYEIGSFSSYGVSYVLADVSKELMIAMGGKSIDFKVAPIALSVDLLNRIA